MKGTVWDWGYGPWPTGYVYRIHDLRSGELLYVGQTGRTLSERIRHHSYHTPWFSSLWGPAYFAITYENYPDTHERYAAEQLAIATESPKHNKAGKPKPPDDPDDVAAILADYADGKWTWADLAYIHKIRVLDIKRIVRANKNGAAA